MAQMDNTGLYQKFGLEQTVPMAGGEYKTFAELREIELKIDLTKATSTASIIQGSDNIEMPAGFTIEQVEIVADVLATSGGTPTLDIGLVRKDRTTEIDFDGIVAAGALTTMDTTGEKTVLTKGSTGAGALIGTTVGSNPGHFTVRANAATYTAGSITVRVKYRKP